VAVDQDYEEFLREWIAKRIWAVGDILDEHDQNYMAERRADELTQLASKHGFGDQLARTVQSHGNVLRYVELLCWLRRQEEEAKRKLGGAISSAAVVAPTRLRAANEAGELRGRPGAISRMAGQMDLRPSAAARAQQRERRREPPPENREDERLTGRPGAPEKKRSRFAALPFSKIAMGLLAALSVLAVVGLAIWKPLLGETRDTSAQPKKADRVGGPSTSPSADEEEFVAQKVSLYEGDPSNPGGRKYVGSVVWRTESVPPAPGQLPDLAIRADIEIPEQKMSMRWSLRVNDNKALPASHIVEVMFTLPPNFVHGGITNIPGVVMKQTEDTRGVALSGRAVKVANNFFLIGLSSSETDRARNIQLLKDRGGIDMPMVYNDGRRAIMAIEKGTAGERAFARAFQAWGQ
jgi:hypothetical protein